MITISARRKLAAFVTALALTTPAVTLAAPAAEAADPCAVTWGSLPRSGGSLSPAPIVTSRTGRHDCYDSFVVELDGRADGYRVAYADEVYTEGQGLPLSPYVGPHGALIGITLLDPAYDAAGRSTYPYVATQQVADVSGYQTFRGVVYGGSFEGYTTFALGVRARLPFQVLVLPGPGAHTRLVVNVAHRWVS